MTRITSFASQRRHQGPGGDPKAPHGYHKFCRFRDAASATAALQRSEVTVAGEFAVMRPAYQRGGPCAAPQRAEG